MKQMALSVLNHESARQRLPASSHSPTCKTVLANGNAYGRWSFLTFVLPYMEQQDAGDPTAGQTNPANTGSPQSYTGTSIRGVWGAMGSMRGNENVTLPE